jgi:hypothetical protein
MFPALVLSVMLQATTPTQAEGIKAASVHATDLYIRCVVEAGRRLEASGEAADLVATAALGDCGTQRRIVQATWMVQCKAEHIGRDLAGRLWIAEVAPSLDDAAKQAALRTIVTARAERNTTKRPSKR